MTTDELIEQVRRDARGAATMSSVTVPSLGTFGPYFNDKYNLKFTVSVPDEEIVEHEFKIEVTYKDSCDCGAAKCKTTHADWCSAK